MSDGEISVIIRKLSELQQEVSLLRAGAAVELSPEAKAAVQARLEARALGYHTVETFAAACGLHPRTVSDRCRARVIRTMPTGTKTYHIPISEECRLNGTNGF